MPSSSDEFLREPNLGQVRTVLTIHAGDERRLPLQHTVMALRLADDPSLLSGCSQAGAANVAVTALTPVIGTT
jgi:hypothetical protein